MAPGYVEKDRPALQKGGLTGLMKNGYAHYCFIKEEKYLENTLLTCFNSHYRYVLGAAVFASMGGFLFGYDQGVM